MTQLSDETKYPPYASNCCGAESSDWHEFNGVKEGFCPDCKEHCEFETNDNAIERIEADTNQASEDVLKDQIDDIFARACKNNEYFGYDGWYELHTPTMRVEIKDLIRTEKLKLLAEVRERVIGENDRGTITNPDSPSYGEPYESVMADKDEQRAELDKLEAEL